MRAFALVLPLVASQAGAADDPLQEMASLIERLGAHETATARHETVVDGCDVTLFYCEDWQDHAKALHSVYLIDLALYDPTANRPAKRQTAWFALGATTEVLMIEMRPPTRLTSELAMRSDPSPPYLRSPREDIDSFVVKKRLFQGLRFDDLPESGCMAALAQLLDDYHLQYCAPTG